MAPRRGAEDEEAPERTVESAVRGLQLLADSMRNGAKSTNLCEAEDIRRDLILCEAEDIRRDINLCEAENIRKI